MTLGTSLLAFLAAVSLLTITPGVDTALVLRAATLGAPKRAIAAALGIGAGCLLWGAAVALGLGALLAASELAFNLLKWIGAAYLAWLGLNMLLRPRNEVIGVATEQRGNGATDWFLKGLLGNLLNPKVGVFYVSFLPQFIPAGVSVSSYSFVLALLHVLLGLLWAGILIIATRPLANLLRSASMIRLLDRLTGSVLLVFATTLALSRR